MKIRYLSEMSNNSHWGRHSPSQSAKLRIFWNKSRRGNRKLGMLRHRHAYYDSYILFYMDQKLDEDYTQAVEMQSLPEVMFEVEETQRTQYGKMVVLLNNKLCMLSLGPDCNEIDVWKIACFSQLLVSSCWQASTSRRKCSIRQIR